MKLQLMSVLVVVLGFFFYPARYLYDDVATVSATTAPPDSPKKGRSPTPPSPADLIASEVGGIVESITSEYGPGYLGNRLIDGTPYPPWKARDTTKLPLDIVFSFFNHQSALISAVTIGLSANSAAGPKAVEVWTSNVSAT